MKLRWLVLCILLACLTAGFADAQQRSLESRLPKRRAFATLLQWDEHAVGVRTLDFSLRKSNNTEDLVVLYTPNVSQKTLNYIKTHSNLLPGNNMQYKILFVEIKPIIYSVTGDQFNMIHLWTLTDYDRIIFLDPAALVVDNLSTLFMCGKFCAAGDLPAPEYCNLAVVALTPSLQTYNELLTFLNHISTTPQPFEQDQQSFFNRFYRWNESVRFYWEDVATRAVPQPQDQVYVIDQYWNNIVLLYYVYRPGWYYNLRKMKVATHDFSWKAWDWWTYPAFDLNYDWFYYPFFRELPNNPYAHPVLPLLLPFVLAAALAYAFVRIGQRAYNAPTLIPSVLVRLHNMVAPSSPNTPAVLAFVAIAAMVYEYHYRINYTDWDPYWSWAVLHGYVILTIVFVIGGYSLILYWKTINGNNSTLPLTLSTGNSSSTGGITTTTPTSPTIGGWSAPTTHAAYASPNFVLPATVAPKWMYLQLALLLVLPVVLYTFVVYRVHQAFGDIAHHVVVIVFALTVQLAAWFKCFREFPMFVFVHLTPQGARRCTQKD